MYLVFIRAYGTKKVPKILSFGAYKTMKVANYVEPFLLTFLIYMR